MVRTNKSIISLWNANGSILLRLLLISSLDLHDIDIVLISESHMTSKNYIKIPNYKIYKTNHPEQTDRGGTAKIVKENIKCISLPNYAKNFLQATTTLIDGGIGPLTISAINKLTTNLPPPTSTITMRSNTNNFYSHLATELLLVVILRPKIQSGDPV